MHGLTREQVAILRAAGRNRVAARIAVLLGEGRIAASAFMLRGADLLRAADSPKRVKLRRRG